MKRILIIAAVLLMIAGCVPDGRDAGGRAQATQQPDVSSKTTQQASADPEATDKIEPEPSVAQTSPEAQPMAVMSSAVSDGVLDAAYGKNGEPKLSPPLEITGAPEGTVCYAIYMDDIDSQPLCGYRWVHWTAVNIKETSIPEDFSRQAGDRALQGTNDDKSVGYRGPAPPDKDHVYVITVYALDEELPLKEGFSKEEFLKAVEGHILASATLEGLYKK